VARYWVQHTQSASKIYSRQLDLLLWKLFQPLSKAFYNWIWLYDIDSIGKEEYDFSQSSKTIPECLYYSSLAGFMVIVNLLLEGLEYS